MELRNAPVQTGLEVFLETRFPQLEGKRVGLLTNPTGVDSRFRRTVDLLHADKRVQLLALFGPEHGLRGDTQAGVKIDETQEQRTGLPVYSLYGTNRRPEAATLAELDALLFDLQDVGVRYATYLATLAYAQEAAALTGLDFVVFDRPNPITGIYVEGNVLDPAFASFVGVHSIPIRHGLTVGELALLFSAEHGWPEPIVVSMRGWRRHHWFDETGLPWISPSLNLPTLGSVTLYPGSCLIEGTNCSEGRGTTHPFEIVGAPWLDPFRVAEELEHCNLPGVAFRPTYFTPTFSKFAHILCGGVQIHILNRNILPSVKLGLHLLHTVRSLNPQLFAWQKDDKGKYFIDLLLGSNQPRHALDAGAQVAEVVADWDKQASTFEERRRPFLLYEV